ncbi:MAG: DUF4055 domain-containing protein [bacterium]|nr:DUF4055 domain-containing protein [bacterium]
MPVDTQHPEYAANRKKVQRMRDAFGGDDAVHAAGVRYLPKLSKQTADDYAAYGQRATFISATRRTADGLKGLIFRKPPVVEAPASLKAILEDITLTGKSLSDLAQSLVDEELTVSRIGLLAEYPVVPPTADGKKRTVAEHEALGFRSFVTEYCAESIINWRQKRVRNVMQPVLIVLDESGAEPSPTDEFELVDVKKIRVLKLDAGNEYVQEVWTENTNGWTLTESIAPVIRGKRLGYIPFFIDQLPVKSPVLEDLAIQELSAFRNTADLENGAHFTGLPTVYISNYTHENDIDKNGNEIPRELSIGSREAWTFKASQYKAEPGYLEFKGDGLGTIERLIDRKLQYMAQLGARMLVNDKAGVEAVGTAEIRTNAETSSLTNIADRVGRTLTKVLQTIAEWEGAPGKVLVSLNKDFMPTGMTAQDLTAVVSAWQAGAISERTKFSVLQAGEIIPIGVTFEEEAAQIEAEAPLLPAPTLPAPAPAKKADDKAAK